MADLKAGTTIGGTLVWTQGNFPLYPTGNTLLYKTFKVYSENDKPSADDNDFVSKANGGTFNSSISVNGTVSIPASTGAYNIGGSIGPGSGDGASLTTANIDIKTWYGVGFYSTYNNKRSVVINARAGELITSGNITAGATVIINNAPTAFNHAARKDYVDNLINNANTNTNTRVLRSGDTMTGNLTAPNLVSNNIATSDNQVPQLSQVIVKGTTLDYGTF